jgi:hypothetical protein
VCVRGILACNLWTRYTSELRHAVDRSHYGSKWPRLHVVSRQTHTPLSPDSIKKTGADHAYQNDDVFNDRMQTSHREHTHKGKKLIVLNPILQKIKLNIDATV